MTRQIILLFHFFGVLLLISMAYSNPAGKPPGEVVQTIFQMIADGKLAELDPYFPVPDTKKIFVEVFSSEFSRKGGVTKFDIEKEEVSGDRAEVKVRWHYKQGGSGNESFPLRRENGVWYINF
jgi:hypothetical protein